MNIVALLLFIALSLMSSLMTNAYAEDITTQELTLGLHDAESRAFAFSNRFKASQADENSAHFQSEAQFQLLLPKLTVQGSYQYLNEIPKVAIGPFPAINFGTNNVYSVGPVVSYTLFDASSTRKAYQYLTLLEQARKEDKESTRLQLLLSTRGAYLQIQLGLEELRAIYDSWLLSEAQRRDVVSKFRAGAASRLELVTAERSALSYQIQFKQKQLELSGSLRDLLALLGDQRVNDPAIEKPGPEGNPEVKFVLRFDPLESTLSEQSRIRIEPPEGQDPQTRSLLAQADALKRNSESQSARAYPLVQVSASVSYNHPDVPNPPTYWQEAFGASLVLPLFIGDPSHAQAAQLRTQADATDFRAAQRKEDVSRDYQKGINAINSLKEQRRLAALDVTQSEEQARLYYTSYKAGKINLIDVQNANVEALRAKVRAAQIDAQIINQIILLRSLGETKGSL